MLPYILKELNKRNIKVGITTAGISLVLLKEIKERKDDQLVKKLSKINIRFGKNCIYDKEV